MTIPDSMFMLENAGSCLPCTPEEELNIVKELTNQAESHLKEGDLYYVVSKRWFSSWRRYVGLNDDADYGQSSDSHSMDVVPSKIGDRPGPINNSDVVQSGSDSEGDEPELRRTLMEELDYVLVPQEVWEKLVEWYKGGPALPRKLICQGNTFSVEVYPLSLNLIDSRDDSQSTISLSKKASLCELYERVCTLKKIEKEKICVWDYFNKEKNAPLPISNQTLEDLNLQMEQDILLVLTADGLHSSRLGMDSMGNELALVPLEPSRSSMSIAGGPTMSNAHSTGYGLNLYPGSALNSSSADVDDGSNIYGSTRKEERGGLAGLQNLGNTCFMNSALQCLVHTPPLVEYFLQDYLEEINTENPLGMHGELALAFGELLRKLWSSGRTTIAPRVFKGKLARFAPQFSGYNQHDSQELLAFLLDGLHEDLNRVKKRPYIEMKDSDGRLDEEVADECWRNHKARNDSVIVDVCQGQYKSTLVCPVCKKISITFDPFMYLSLPLPSTLKRTMTVTVFYGDGSGLPMPSTVTVLKHGYIKDLIQALSIACCLKSDETLLIAEVYDHHVFRYYERGSEELASIKDDEHIVAYRFRRGEGKTRLEIVHRCREKYKSDSVKGTGRKRFGTSLVAYLEENPVRGADIEVAVFRVLSPLRRISSPAKTRSGKENGFPSEILDELPESCNAQSIPRDQRMENVEIGDSLNQELSFQLFLTDDSLMKCVPILRNSVLKSEGVMKVYLDWTEKEQELYDASYLKDLPVVYNSGYTAKKTRQESISLFSCLEAFLTEEPLGPDDMWYCPRCKEHRQATKKLDLWMLPDILVFHLKRFSYGRYQKNKLDTFVNFPVYNLDLTKYVKSMDGQSYVYELYAISNHYGGLGGGHYTAYAKLINDNRWYHFDDTHVSPVTEADIRTSAAYVLFYKRVQSETKAGLGETSRGHPIS
ncbi:Ubiquitin carboxyl-terminal hydrolase 10 [Tripterygium wilfordii]|uniref:Ubiquitin carboxyl-terminal hydrolase n=1 Tax=Tripterygium wilfordii TaxID=458696 RepID=A0A7J7CK29_TRIWF|nr:ubiquitin carboxyl-terminal hydrolase 9-like [Tripterygium wilfordii]KAF5734371.1 Ubiquitin carboxyl-terminal hydrolase 10 [Tripterygium wilfordii]